MGRPRDPGALRRTGMPVHLRLPPEEWIAATTDAAKRGLSMNAHIRDLLDRWRRRKMLRLENGTDR